jgi:cytohesin
MRAGLDDLKNGFATHMPRSIIPAMATVGICPGVLHKLRLRRTTRIGVIGVVLTIGWLGVAAGDSGSPQGAAAQPGPGGPEVSGPVQGDGHTPLYAAARAGDVEKIKALLKAGADVNARDSQGMTPLEGAILSGKRDAVAELVAAHADMNTPAKRGWFVGYTPLYQSFACRDPSIANLLLEAGGDPNNVSDDGTPALNAVAGAGFLELAELLVAHGALVNASDKTGWTPLLCAAVKGHGEMVEYLLAHGGQLDIFAASATGRLDYIVGAIARDKSVVALSAPDGQTPLHVAADCGRADAAGVLLLGGAAADARDDHKETPLHKAAALGRVAVVDLLLSRHADEEAQNGSGATPLLVAARAGQTAVAKLLLDHGANISAKGFHLRTALHYAASVREATTTNQPTTSGNVALAEVLLELGAEVDARDETGWTPLHDAARSGNQALVELLLKHRADPSAKTTSGETPADVAQEMKHPEIAQMLKDAAQHSTQK